jgi:hypothetical protein
MTQRGQIYHNPNFKFHDGETGNKLLILLNTPTKDDEYLFVKTTARESKRTKQPGCIKHPLYEQGEYFLQKGETSFFKEPTWIILSEIYPIHKEAIVNSSDWHKLKKNAILPTKIIDKIIDCMFKFHGDDIPEIYENWLRPTINTSILKLREKFNS